MFVRLTALARPVVQARCYHASPRIFAPSALFNAASAAVQQVASAPSNEDKLALYALFKQATVGKNTSPKPSMLDFVAKAKWQAWSDVSSYSSEEAEKKYVELCRKLGANFDESGPKTAAPITTESAHLLIKNEGKVRFITFNRPAKRNSISLAMYNDLGVALDDAARDPTVLVTVITGAGPFFSAGTDLSDFTKFTSSGGMNEAVEMGRKTLHTFVNKFIHFPKLLVGAVNGPAVGIAVTTLPLYDVVFCSHKATIHAPLIALGQCPEGTSSYTFPKVMGPARANELLLLGRKLSATEARDWGLVNDVFEDGEFTTKINEKVQEYAALPPEALTTSKQFMRKFDVAGLDAANEAECAFIKQRWLSSECASAVMAALSKGKK